MIIKSNRLPCRHFSPYRTALDYNCIIFQLHKPNTSLSHQQWIGYKMNSSLKTLIRGQTVLQFLVQNVTSEVAPIRVIPCCTASDPPCLILSCFTTLRKKAIMDLIWNWIVIISHRCSANAVQSIAVYCSLLHYELCTCAIHRALCTMHCALCNLLHYALTCCTCQAGSPTEFIWP